jgi:uncharacterized protein (TIGR02391 family)
LRELLTAIPNVETLLALEPEELGAKLLFLIRTRNDRMFSLDGYQNEPWDIGVPEAQRYPINRRPQALQALMEAWTWLEAQGLVVPAEGTNGRNGWRVLSRRARKFENPQAFANYQTAKLLPKDILHESISERVWLAFTRGEYDTAVFEAMKQVEIMVRAGAELGDGDVGVKLMRKAFHPENGALTDQSAEAGERQALMELFSGAIGSYKNPQSHRDVNLENPIQAMEIILLANQLLRIAEARGDATA